MTERPSVALPIFADWRVAYLAADGNLHVVTTDGKTDRVGPHLDGLTINGLHVTSAGFAPDGHLLAYEGAAGLAVVDVTGRQSTDRIPKVSSYDIAWSPDGSRLALGDGTGGLGIVRIADGTLAPLSGTEAQGVRNILGWLDNEHLAVSVVSANGDTPSIGLGALDTASGRLRIIAQFTSTTLGTSTPTFALSPDGKKALLFNRRFRNDPYTPLVDEIDTATGAVAALPHLAQIIGPYSGFTSLAWRPGTETIAVSTGYGENGDLKAWLLDLQHDTAQQLPEAAYPMGWAPDGRSLALSTGWQSGINGGPYTMSVVTLAADGQASTTPLAGAAMTFPWLGFVRTA